MAAEVGRGEPVLLNRITCPEPEAVIVAGGGEDLVGGMPSDRLDILVMVREDS